MKTYYIVGKTKDTELEIIDEFTDKAEARRCLSEYRMAFGPGWTIRLTTRRPKGL